MDTAAIHLNGKAFLRDLGGCFSIYRFVDAFSAVVPAQINLFAISAVSTFLESRHIITYLVLKLKRLST